MASPPAPLTILAYKPVRQFWDDFETFEGYFQRQLGDAPAVATRSSGEAARPVPVRCRAIIPLDGNSLDDESLPSRECRILSVLIEGQYRVSARVDCGADDVMVMGSNHREALLNHDIELREWQALEEPLPVELALVAPETPSENPASAHACATHTFRVDYAIETIAGRVHLRNRLCYYVDAEVPEFLISDQCLKSIGIDVDGLVTDIARCRRAAGIAAASLVPVPAPTSDGARVAVEGHEKPVVGLNRISIPRAAKRHSPLLLKCLIIAWILVFVVISSLDTTTHTNLSDTPAFELDSIRNNSPSLACFVMLNEEDLRISAPNTLEGWGHACSEFVFFSSSSENHEHADVHVRFYDTNEEPREAVAHVVDILDAADDVSDKLGHKSWLCWRYMLERFTGEVDFIVKADLDTFVLKENLFAFLRNHDPKEPVYAGRRFKSGGIAKKPFVAGAFTIVSAAAASMMVPKLTVSAPTSSWCSRRHWASKGHGDDVAFAECLFEIGIEPEDTRDAFGKEMFMVLSPENMANEDANEGERWRWYHDRAYNSWFGKRCCSADAIAFHYVDTEKVKSGKLKYINETWQWQ